MGHRVLSDELIARAGELAALGLPLLSVAKGCGVGERTLHLWLKSARDGVGSDLEMQLMRSIDEGHLQGEMKLVRRLEKLAEEGDGRSATWLLSHGPARNSWSDAAAVRRAEWAILQRVADGIQSSRLSDEAKQEVILNLRCQGLPGVDPAEGEP